MTEDPFKDYMNEPRFGRGSTILLWLFLAVIGSVLFYYGCILPEIRNAQHDAQEWEKARQESQRIYKSMTPEQQRQADEEAARFLYEAELYRDEDRQAEYDTKREHYEWGY